MKDVDELLREFLVNNYEYIQHSAARWRIQDVELIFASELAPNSSLRNLFHSLLIIIHPGPQCTSAFQEQFIDEFYTLAHSMAGRISIYSLNDAKELMNRNIVCPEELNALRDIAHPLDDFNKRSNSNRSAL